MSTEDAVRALNKIERLLQQGERDARLLDGREYKHRRYAEAYRLLSMLRQLVVRNG